MAITGVEREKYLNQRLSTYHPGCDAVSREAPTLSSARVTLIGGTWFTEPEHVPWTPDPESRQGEDMIELAGRACYQSWTRPRPETATNAGYLKNILKTGHFSILEHAQATFYVENVSRSLTHELIRSRHLSPSQLSQRFVDESGVEMVVPPLVAQSVAAQDLFNIATDAAKYYYGLLVAQLTHDFPDATRKEVREAARSLLPNAAETKIVMTGNYRAWRHFVDIRATEHADREIRALAVELLRQLQGLAPNVFGDYEIKTLPNGSEVASSPYREVS